MMWWRQGHGVVSHLAPAWEHVCVFYSATCGEQFSHTPHQRQEWMLMVPFQMQRMDRFVPQLFADVGNLHSFLVNSTDPHTVWFCIQLLPPQPLLAAFYFLHFRRLTFPSNICLRFFRSMKYPRQAWRQNMNVIRYVLKWSAVRARVKRSLSQFMKFCKGVCVINACAVFGVFSDMIVPQRPWEDMPKMKVRKSPTLLFFNWEFPIWVDLSYVRPPQPINKWCF